MKKRIARLCQVLVLSVLLTTALMPMAHAYLDPAATSYIIQIVSGVVIACGVTIGIFWKKIRVFFHNMRMKSLEKRLTKQAESRDESI